MQLLTYRFKTNWEILAYAKQHGVDQALADAVLALNAEGLSKLTKVAQEILQEGDNGSCQIQNLGCITKGYRKIGDLRGICVGASWCRPILNCLQVLNGLHFSCLSEEGRSSIIDEELKEKSFAFFRAQEQKCMDVVRQHIMHKICSVSGNLNEPLRLFERFKAVLTGQQTDFTTDFLFPKNQYYLEDRAHLNVIALKVRVFRQVDALLLSQKEKTDIFDHFPEEMRYYAPEIHSFTLSKNKHKNVLFLTVSIGKNILQRAHLFSVHKREIEST